MPLSENDINSLQGCKEIKITMPKCFIIKGELVKFLKVKKNQALVKI